MNAQAKPSEPSMEEILASIRRIIADDEVKPAEAEAPVVDVPVAAEPAESEIDEDILDLGAEAEPLVALAPEPAAEPAPLLPPSQSDDLDFLEASEPAASRPEPEPEQIRAPEPPAPEPFRQPEAARMAQPAAASAPSLDMAQLLSDQASSSVTSAFGHLAHTVLSNNARTLEDLVKDMLKPMLKAWLDDNLPVMVERLVRAEIERVARGPRS